MDKKKSKDKKYQQPDSSSVVNESQAEYIVQSEADIFDKYGERQYYTHEEFFSILKTEINNRFGYEVIKEND